MILSVLYNEDLRGQNVVQIQVIALICYATYMQCFTSLLTESFIFKVLCTVLLRIGPISTNIHVYLST